MVVIDCKQCEETNRLIEKAIGDIEESNRKANRFSNITMSVALAALLFSIFSMLRKLGFLLFLLVFYSINYSTTCYAQDLRSQLDSEFVGLETTFVYRDSNTNEIIIQPLTTRLSRFKRGTKCQKLTALNSDPQTLPTASLAFEHWWLSFEMLMICQREFAECVAVHNDRKAQKGECAIDDPTCPGSIYALLILVLRDYWVPANIVFQYGVPTREEYISHFIAGLDGINQLIPNIKACQDGLK